MTQQSKRSMSYEPLEARMMLANSAPAVGALIGAWEFEEGAGSTTEDVSGSAHTGALAGAMWTQDETRGSVLQFDGIDDAVDTGAWDVASSELTLSAWFRADSFDESEGRLISKATGIQAQDHYWMLSTFEKDGMKLRFRLKAGGTTKTLIADTGDLQVGQWMHAAAVYDGLSMRLYLDGVEVGATAHSGLVSTNAQVAVSIGDNPGGLKPFDGLIDDVLVYDQALSPEEIGTLATEQLIANQAPVVDAGAAQVVDVSDVITLSASVVDDQRPSIANLAGTLAVAWSVVSGPGEVTFGDNLATDSTATFSEVGTYVLRLTADDGELSSTDDVTITVTGTEASSEATVLPNGLAGLWSFEEGSGLTTADASGDGHAGVLSGATWTSAGRVGNALSFDGVNDSVDTGAWNVDSGALTIATWFRADNLDVDEARLISKAAGLAEQDHWWMLSTIENNGQKLRFRLKADGTTKTLVAGQGDLVAGQWMHAAAVYDGSTMRLYLDGVEVGAVQHSGRVSSDGSVPVVIGDNPGGLRPFAGLIDEMRVYDIALSPAEIAALISEVPGAKLAPSPPPVPNQPPVVSAGPNRSVVVSSALAVNGSVSDDGLPDSNSAVTTMWSKVSGPGEVVFGDKSAVDTAVTFSQPGIYGLQLTANDGQLSASDTVTIEVTGDERIEYYKRFYDQTYDKFAAKYDTLSKSGWGPSYYTFQYVFGGTLSMYEATQDISYLERSLTWAESMISRATIVDRKGKLNWKGNWAVSSTYASQGIASLLEDAQASTELARLSRLIVTDPTLNARYGTRAKAIYNFVRDHIVEKHLWDRYQLSWHTYNAGDQSVLFSDRSSLLMSTMTHLKLANDVLGTNDRVKRDYAPIINQLVAGFRDRLVRASGDAACDSFGNYSGNALIYDCGVNHYKLRNHANDTSHANRAAAMAADLHEAGIAIQHNEVAGLALLVNDVIWDGSLTSPRFNNHIDGNNDPNLGKDAFELGIIYSGWVKLAQYNPQTLAIFDATLRAMDDGVSNPSLDQMNNLQGRTALAGHLAKAVAHSAANLEAAEGAVATPDVAALTQDQLQPIVDFAIGQIKATSSIDSPIDSPMNVLDHVEFDIVDLEGAVLGQATPDKVTIDVNAAGHGWFVDVTPDQDEEFDRDDQSGVLTATEESSAAQQIDLLTVVMHELGHVLGHDHVDGDGLMAETLAVGVRKTADAEAFDIVHTEELFLDDATP